MLNIYFQLLSFLVLVGVSGQTEVPLRQKQMMRTVRMATVFEGPKRVHRIGRILPGAVVKVSRTNQKKGCKRGWFQLEVGGFICGRTLRSTEDVVVSPAAEDEPSVVANFDKYRVLQGGAVAYLNKTEFQHRRSHVRLYKNSILTVKNVIVRGGTKFLKTRNGLFVYARNTEKLEPVYQLGVALDFIPANAALDAVMKMAGGFVVSETASIVDSPGDDADVVSHPALFAHIPGPVEVVSEKWIKLGEDRYIRESEFARFRDVNTATVATSAPSTYTSTAFFPNAGKRWMSVDLQEQLLVAWEGTRPVRMIPASTGKKGNTQTGIFNVKWKRRIQDMNAYNGHFTVQDVQWVMYYIPERSFAIHSAWHKHFGHPVSHGCVNVPQKDARWLYEWALPVSPDVYSESFHTKDKPGTVVVIFR